jgi:predicted transcriptional regulator
MTQRELAHETGVPQPAIARIERGMSSPTLSTLERLLAGTGQSLEIAPALGLGVDRTLIAASLRQTPEERVAGAGLAARRLNGFLNAVRHGTRR